MVYVVEHIREADT